MGFRYRKSKNLGKGFRVNMSKSGPGFSWGTKGLRITRTAKGNIRGTAYIPGTGLSYQKDFGNPSKKHQAKKASANSSKQTVEASNTFTNDLGSISSSQMADINNMLSKDKGKNIIGFAIILLGIVLFFFNKYLLIVSLLGLAYLLYTKKNDGIMIDYDMTPEAERELKETNQLLAGIMESDAVWRVTSTADPDPSTGADMQIISRTPLTLRAGNDEISTNAETFTLDASDSKLIFLPDAIFIKEGGQMRGVGLDEVTIDLSKMTFLEEGKVPADATVLGETYEHVTKDGNPDKRYKNNPKMTLVEYGMLSINKQPGIDSLIVFSDTVLDGK